MKKIFKNIAMMFMVGVSGITMNTEARLPTLSSSEGGIGV